MLELKKYVVSLRMMYENNLYINYSQLSSYGEIPRIGLYGYIKLICTAPYHVLPTWRMQREVRLLASESTREQHNDRVIARAQETIFEVEGNKLDSQQIEAVVACEDAQLVMAAAGSGKTLSLLAKVRYLVDVLRIDPGRILTLSFTKKSADELRERLASMNISVDGKTFHALGMSLIHTEDTKVLQGPAQSKRVKGIIAEMIKTDEQFARQYNDYILHYFTMPLPLMEYDSLKNFVGANRAFRGRTLKAVSLNKSNYASEGRTARGEIVRSKEEQIIANFLYINNIPYEYERPYPGYGNYHPDFTITLFDEPIYLEHQGVDRNGRTRADIDARKYHKKIEWSRNYHREKGTRLIETFSYEFTEGTVLRVLEERLRSEGIDTKRRHEGEVTELITGAYGNDVGAFYDLIISYVSLLKTSDFTLDDILQRARSIKGMYARQRTLAFLAVFEPIYDAYEDSLYQAGEIDFSDMIVQAAETVPVLSVGLAEYDYILVDEVQDMSGARYRLLKALLDRVPRSRLFAVGDDWQSIYRFTGSDNTLLRQFDQRFERFTRHSAIEQTHRFSSPLLDISSDFIKANHLQARKQPYSTKQSATTVDVVTTSDAMSDAASLRSALENLADDIGMDELKTRSILLISRYKRDIERVRGDAEEFRILGDNLVSWMNQHGESIELQFITMHAAKGLTCDHAFILNANGGAYGIPAERSEDPVVSMLLADPDPYPHAEERRLFYVAMTRAKQSTTILATPDNPSPFLQELNLGNTLLDQQELERCPACESGVLRLRNGAYGPFYGCSNYSFGCSYNRNTDKKAVTY